jgi:hypothetical protein
MQRKGNEQRNKEREKIRKKNREGRNKHNYSTYKITA